MGCRVVVVVKGRSNRAIRFLRKFTRTCATPSHTRQFAKQDEATWSGKLFKQGEKPLPVRVVRVTNASQVAAHDPDVIVAEAMIPIKSAYHYGESARGMMPCKCGHALPVALSSSAEVAGDNQLISRIVSKLFHMGPKPDPAGHAKDPMAKVNG